MEIKGREKLVKRQMQGAGLNTPSWVRPNCVGLGVSVGDVGFSVRSCIFFAVDFELSLAPLCPALSVLRSTRHCCLPTGCSLKDG